MFSPAIRYILRIGRCKSTFSRTTIHINDLSDSSYLYISYICRHPGDTQDKLSVDLCVDKTTVAHQINMLEKKGYIYRENSNEDKRCKCVYPTQKAKDIFLMIHDNHAYFTDRLMDGLSEQEQKDLEVLLSKVYNNAIALLKEKGGI